MESRVVGCVILWVLRAFAWFYYFSPSPLKKIWWKSVSLLLSGVSLRRKVVDQNLSYAFPESAEMRAKVREAAYDHLSQLTFEILMLLGPMPRFVRRNVELRGLEHWQDAKRAGKGVIFLSSHVGNWEVMAAGGAMLGGMDLMLVTKHLKPEWLHRAIETGRARCGVSATYEPRTLRDVLAHLKRNGTVGIVLDQYAGPPVGIRVPVFGIPVGTSGAIATLAKRTGATVLPVVNYRSDDRWIIDIRKPIPWKSEGESSTDGDCDATYEIALNTSLYAQVLERDIYSYPEQWLWIHRRFKGDLGPLRDGEWAGGRSRR